MTMGMSFSMGQRMETRQEMTLEQRQLIVQSQIISLRFELIGLIHGEERYHPEAKCPKCLRELTPLEILKGFSSDPNDFNTTCTSCQHRFQPLLVWSNQSTRISMSFYCDIQTQEQLRGLENLSPDQLKKEHGEVYHSAIAHHGMIRNAFAAMGVTYPFDEVADIKQKVEPFLGRLPDTVIAELSGVKVNVVRRMRKSAHISACTHKSLLENAPEEDSE